MPLRENGPEQREPKANTDREWFGMKGSERPVVEPAAVTEPESGRIVADERGHNDVGNNLFAARGDRYVPDPFFKPFSGRPGSKKRAASPSPRPPVAPARAP